MVTWDGDEFFETNCLGEVRNNLLEYPTWLRTPLTDLSLGPWSLDIDNPTDVARYVERYSLADNRAYASLEVLAAGARRRWEAAHPDGSPFAGVFLTDEWRNRLRAEPEAAAPVQDDGQDDFDDLPGRYDAPEDPPGRDEDPHAVLDVEARVPKAAPTLEPGLPAPPAPAPPTLWDGPNRPAAGSYREVDRPDQ